MFATSLFDFDFVAERENRESVFEAVEARESYRQSKIDDHTRDRGADLAEIIDDWVVKLERMALRAVDEGRMGAYFRILDSLCAWREMDVIESELNCQF